MKSFKNMKYILILLGLYVLFVFLFVKPKYGPQVQKMPSEFENTPPLDLNLGELPVTSIDKQTLSPQQLESFNKLIENFSLSEDVVIKSLEEQDFSDTSMGCPKDGYSYSQVIVPGVKFLLIDSGGERDYRISNDLEYIVDCSASKE